MTSFENYQPGDFARAVFEIVTDPDQLLKIALLILVWNVVAVSLFFLMSEIMGWFKKSTIAYSEGEILVKIPLKRLNKVKLRKEAMVRVNDKF